MAPQRTLLAIFGLAPSWTAQELHEAEQGKVQSPAPGEAQPHSPVHTGGKLAGKQLSTASRSAILQFYESVYQPYNLSLSFVWDGRDVNWLL